MIWLIARREMHTLFSSPFGWCLVGAVQCLLGIIFFHQLRYFLEPPPEAVLLPELWGLTRIAIVPMLNWAAFLLALVIPLLTMRLFSDERRLQTLPLLLSAPITAAQIVLGKLSACVLVVLLLLALALAPIAVFVPSVSLDYGIVLSALIAVILFATTLTALGLWISSCTDNSTLAAAITLAIAMASWLIGAQMPADLTPPLKAALQHLSWHHHLQLGLTGVFSTATIAFHAVLIAVFVFFSRRRVQLMRRFGT